MRRSHPSHQPQDPRWSRVSNPMRCRRVAVGIAPEHTHTRTHAPRINRVSVSTNPPNTNTRTPNQHTHTTLTRTHARAHTHTQSYSRVECELEANILREHDGRHLHSAGTDFERARHLHNTGGAFVLLSVTGGRSSKVSVLRLDGAFVRGGPSRDVPCWEWLMQRSR